MKDTPNADGGGPVRARTIQELKDAAGEEGYLQIRAEFLSSTESRLVLMSESVRTGDSEGLRRSAHALKGASGSLGAEKLSSLCRELEALLAAGAPPEARAAAVAGVAAEFASVRRALLEAA